MMIDHQLFFIESFVIHTCCKRFNHSVVMQIIFS